MKHQMQISLINKIITAILFLIVSEAFAVLKTFEDVEDISPLKLVSGDIRGRSFEGKGGCRIRFVNIQSDETTVFSNSVFPCTDFRDNAFPKVVFDNGDFMGCIFRCCVLRGASFRGARLRGADFTGADVTDIIIDENTELIYSKGLEHLFPQTRASTPQYHPPYASPTPTKMDFSLLHSFVRTLVEMRHLRLEEERFRGLVSCFSEELDDYREVQIPLVNSTIFPPDLTLIMANRGEKFHRKVLSKLKDLGVEQRKILLIERLSQAVGFGNMGFKVSLTGEMGIQVYFQDYFGLSEVLHHKRFFDSEPGMIENEIFTRIHEGILDSPFDCFLGIECSPRRPISFEAYAMIDSSRIDIVRKFVSFFSVDEAQLDPYLSFFQTVKKLVLSFNALNLQKGVAIQVMDFNIMQLKGELEELERTLDQETIRALHWILEEQKREAFKANANNFSLRLSPGRPQRTAWYVAF